MLKGFNIKTEKAEELKYQHMAKAVGITLAIVFFFLCYIQIIQ